MAEKGGADGSGGDRAGGGPRDAARPEPTSGHSARFRPGEVPAADDGRLFSAVYERNAPPLIAALEPWLKDRRGRALEIGSGTGQHVVAFARAFPALHWVPSDPDPVHRASIDAWRRHARAPTAPARALDAARDWAREVADLAPLQLVISLNVIHIAPFAVTEGIVAGAARVLAPGGLLAFYGPFVEGGRHTGAGNARFDARLRADNPEWGLRDVDEIRALAARAGLEFGTLTAMPANNRLLLFVRPR